MTDAEQELIAQVRELARGPFRERAPEADATGLFGHENAAALRELGVPGLMVAESLGGRRPQRRDGGAGDRGDRLGRRLDRGGGQHAPAGHVAARGWCRPFPRRNAVLKAVAEEGAWCCAPGSIPLRELDNRTTGYAATEEGTDLLWNGRAGFASMSDAARFVVLGGQIDHGEERQPDLAIALADLDADGVTNHGNWDGMGLRATASHDISVENLRMPRADALIIPQALLQMADQMQTQQQWQRRAYPGFGILAIWLGNAQALFDEVVSYVQRRHGYLASSRAFGALDGLRSEQPWAQMAIGEMEHWLGTGRSLLYDALRQVEQPFPRPSVVGTLPGADDLSPAADGGGGRAGRDVGRRGARLRSRQRDRSALPGPHRRNRDGLEDGRAAALAGPLGAGPGDHDRGSSGDVGPAQVRGGAKRCGLAAPDAQPHRAGDANSR